MAATRYAIHMETGVIVPMTSETLENYIYQEIEPNVALMVDRGELDAKYVIEQIEKQLPKTSLRDKLKLVSKQNVRQSDFGLKEAARAAVDMGESRVVKIPLPKADNPKPGKKPAPKAPASKKEPAPEAPASEGESASEAPAPATAEPKVNV